MAEKLTSTAKKSKPKKIDGKTKEELQWEIRVCKAAIEKKEREWKKNASVGGIIGGALRGVLGFVFIALLCAVVPGIIFIGLGTIEERIPQTILIAVVMAAIVMFIDRKREIKALGSPSVSRDYVEVIAERLRIANALLLALEKGDTVSDAEKQYCLSFAEAEEKKCGNCAHLGKTMLKTTTTYSDGTTTNSTHFDHYFCGSLGGMQVKKNNVCEKFLSKRVALAFQNSDKYYKEMESSLREQDKKALSGFR